MAGLAASDVSYSINKKKLLEDGRKIIQATITFGDGAKTYPSGGVPLTKGKLGCPVVIDSLKIIGTAASGYAYEYDGSAVALRMLQSPSHSHSLLLKDAVQADGATTRVNAAANKLGANTGGDLTVAGGGANGGVQAVAAGALSELATSVAPAAQTLKVEIIGY